jgi:hypothetical protein
VGVKEDEETGGDLIIDDVIFELESPHQHLLGEKLNF